MFTLKNNNSSSRGDGAREKKGAFTVIELVLVLGIVAIVSIVSLLNLTGRRSTTQLDGATRQIGSLLREAQSKAASQYASAQWGVHFENLATTSFYGMFKGSSYTATSAVSYYALPAKIYYVTSTLAQNAKLDVVFAQVSGKPSASATISIYLADTGTPSSTISVNAYGSISY